MSQDTSSQAKHLNTQAVTELQELLGKTKFKYLVDVFCENSSKSIEFLLENNQDHDFEGLYASAHSMAGSSANMGALVLCELCRQLEQQAKAHEGEHISALIQGIVVEHKQVLVEFNKMVA